MGYEGVDCIMSSSPTLSAMLQSQTNKDNNFEILRTTKFFSNLTSDSNSEYQKTSENMLFINFPQVIKVAKSLGELLGHLGTLYVMVINRNRRCKPKFVLWFLVRSFYDQF